MRSTPAGRNRLFALVDPRTRHTIGFCAGPGPSGECPSFVAGQPIPCEGYRLVPMKGTSVNGLPFLAKACEGDRCPLAWVDSLAADAVVQPPVHEPQEGGPHWGPEPSARGSLPTAL